MAELPETNGMYLKELRDMFNKGMQLDFPALEAEFTKICYDYNYPLDKKYKSISSYFATEVLKNVDPMYRELKKKDGDTLTRLRLLEMDENSLRGSIAVCTFKFTAPPKMPPAVKENQLILTVQQARLLATNIISLQVPLLLSSGCIPLTPMAEAVFNREELMELFYVLSRNYPEYEMTLISFIQSIIQSCEIGGHYLDQSKAHIAAVAVVFATKNMKNRSAAKSIVSKLLKQYIAAEKEFDPDKYILFADYAYGILPDDMGSENLIMQVEDIKKLTPSHMREKKNKNKITVEVIDLFGDFTVKDLISRFNQI